MDGPYLTMEIVPPDGPTFPRSGSVIDLFLTTVSWHNMSSKQLNPFCSTIPSISEHYGISLNLDLSDYLGQTLHKDICWSFKNFNWGKFTNKLDADLSEIDIPNNRNLSNEEIDIYIQMITIAIISNVEAQVKVVKQHRNYRQKSINMNTFFEVGKTFCMSAIYLKL